MCKTATAVRVYRQRGQRFSENCVQKRYRGGGGSVHVWAGITQFNKTDLVILNENVNARCYFDNVLRPVALPFLRKIIGEVTLYTNMTLPQLIVSASLSIFWQQIGLQC